MTRETASSVIKLTAIIVIFAGLIFLSVTFIQLQAMGNMFNSFGGGGQLQGAFESSMMWYGYTTPIIIIIWGGLLYLLNQPLSLLIAKKQAVKITES